MIAIFKHEGRKQHKSDIKKVDFITITVIDTGKAVLMYEPFPLPNNKKPPPLQKILQRSRTLVPPIRAAKSLKSLPITFGLPRQHTHHKYPPQR